MINGGALEVSFAEVAQATHIWNRIIPSASPKSIYRIIWERLQYKFTGVLKRKPTNQEIVLNELKNEKFDLIYANTIVSNQLLPILKQYFAAPVISHIHEMPFSIRAYFSNMLNVEYTSLIDWYICVSKLAAKNVSEEWCLPPDKITLINEFIDISRISQPAVGADLIRNELLLKNCFVVGACGTGNWRKGIDLFINISRLFTKNNPGLSVKFIWVGDVSKEVIEGYHYENALLNVESNIIFTGVSATPQNYFQIFDVFLLTSREDPFPLVGLEVAALSKPMVCFAGATGIVELIAEDGGKVVPYANIDTMAAEIFQLFHDKEKLKLMGENLFSRVKQYDVSVTAPKILQLIEKVIGDVMSQNKHL